MLLSASIDSIACLLLTAEPDRAASLQTSCKHLTKRDAGRSQMEHRRAFSGELRWTISFTALLDRAKGTALRAALRGYGNEPILCRAGRRRDWYPMGPRLHLRAG
ncbi:MAG: hypothetical protein IPL39_14420 [Opitutaceae bacterium]|nr:hypothetical protein [Opitutaceae bacterium]